MTNEGEFLRELTSLLNKYSAENSSNTPDFLLAEYMMMSLRGFDQFVERREDWYGRGHQGPCDGAIPVE